MHITAMMEQFSRAYVGAIAAQAGCNYCVPAVDDDSIDIILMKKDIHDCKRSRAQIDLQIKCTHSIDCNSEYFSFSLSIKNYNDLRADTTNPRLLVIVCIPEKYENWTKQTKGQLCLFCCAYWVSLKDKPKTDNLTNISVSIPTNNIFSVEFLENEMRKYALSNIYEITYF